MTKAMPVHRMPSANVAPHAFVEIACDGHCAIANGSNSSADMVSVADATAAGGKPVRWRRTRLMPKP